MPYLKPDILAKSQKVVSGYDEALFLKGYDFVKSRLSAGQKERLSAAIDTIRILLEMHPDFQMLLATLLHCLPVEEKTIGTTIRQEFGAEIALLVENLKKLDSIRIQNDAEQFDLLRLMLIAMAKDLRVIVILLAERLNRLHHLEEIPSPEKDALTRQTLSIYSPIAARLGIFALKGPLEDIAFAYLYPAESEEIKEQMTRLEAYRERVIQNSGKRLKLLLKQNNIQGQILGRTKNLYSIYRKLQKRGERHIDAVHDIFAMRVIVSSVAECYSVLGILHEHFIPISNRFKDYIAAPKPNGYQSLHTTVIGLAGITRQSFPIEVQIRTEDMNTQAEYGVAAHWHYKEKGSVKRGGKQVKIKDFALDVPVIGTGVGEKILMSGEAAKQLIKNRIFTLTPAGAIINLPEGATPIDFAFAIHSDLGLSMRIAKVNGKPVPVGNKLSNGDVVEIINGKTAQPNQAWLKLAVTKKAKGKLRAFFREHDSATLLREGKSMLNAQLVQSGLPELDQNLTLLRDYAGKHRTKREREDLLIKIGNGALNATKIIREFSETPTVITPSLPKEKASYQEPDQEPTIMIGGWPNVPYRLADCCKPKIGSRIIGYVTRGTHVTIHHIDCRTLKKLDPRRFIEAYFGDSRRQDIRLNVYQRSGHVPRLNDITETLTRLGVPIKNLFLRSGLREKPGIILEVEIHDSEELLAVINEIEEIRWINSVKLVQE